MYRDQFGEFVCGYWGLKGKSLSLIISVNLATMTSYVGFECTSRKCPV